MDKILIISLWTIIFGLINLWMGYLTEVRYRRPDFADEYKFISWRTMCSFLLGITGPLGLFIMAIGLSNAKDELEWYHNQVCNMKYEQDHPEYHTYSKKKKHCNCSYREEHEYD